MEGEGRDGYRDQIGTCDVGACVCIPRQIQYGDGTSAQYYAYISIYQYTNLFPVLFLKSLYVPFQFEFFIYLYIATIIGTLATKTRKLGYRPRVCVTISPAQGWAIGGIVARVWRQGYNESARGRTSLSQAHEVSTARVSAI